jgi:hypothetical protein
MRKILTTAIFVFILVTNTHAQSMVLLEHSNSFEETVEGFQEIVQEIGSAFYYFDSGMEKKFSPSDEKMEIIGDDKFAILWFSGGTFDINYLFLCNIEASEAIIFSFCKEYREGYISCSVTELSIRVFNHILIIYNDPKWYVIPE